MQQCTNHDHIHQLWIWLIISISINYTQSKTPINMKFGMQVHFSAIYNEFSFKFPYLSYFWPYCQKYILMHINFYIQTKKARIMNDTTFPRYFDPGNTMLMLF